MAGKVEERKIVKRVKAGDIITVRAKNGTCMPMFYRKPSAYRCTIEKQSVPSIIVAGLLKRRVIKPVKVGWFSEGQFQFNRDLRDERGRFRSRKDSSHGR